MTALYQHVVPLSAARVAGRGLNPDYKANWLKTMNAIPVNAAEFSIAARRVPIVFLKGQETLPAAVFGIRTNENLFLDEAKMEWKNLHYAPAYVRRYPFVMAKDQNGTMGLAIDEAPGVLIEGGRQLFASDGQPTQLAMDALNFSREFQVHAEATRRMTDAILEAGVLTERQTAVELSPEKRYQIGKFLVVDEQRLRALPDRTFLLWRDKGWLSAIYVHLQSQQNWSQLIEMLAEREGVDPMNVRGAIGLAPGADGVQPSAPNTAPTDIANDGGTVGNA